MPLYDYQCESCGNRFEVIQKFSDPAVTTCEKCGGSVRKLLSAPAIQFKGSGWYVTDYGRKGGAGGGDAARSSKTKTDESSKPAGESAGAEKTGATSGSTATPASAGGSGGSGTSGSGGNSDKN